jgi:putative FmdB family regulatory protein
MPLYEYKCETCGKKFDALQKFSDEPLSVHEECGGVLERLISPPAFHFKGTGWYVTDYAKSNGVSAPASDGSSSKDDGAKKADTKEAKTETKTETSTPAPAATPNSK